MSLFSVCVKFVLPLKCISYVHFSNLIHVASQNLPNGKNLTKKLKQFLCSKQYKTATTSY